MAKDEPDIVTRILDTTTREDGINAILAHLVDEGLIPFEAAPEIQTGIDRRETLGTTAIGNGVAFPHLRHICVDHPLLAVGLLKTPSEGWDSLDGDPVDLVFLLIVPYENVGPSCKRFFEMLMRRLTKGLGNRLRQATSTEELASLVRTFMPEERI
jgi:mannitol/fructose-specific phosphotransferase system IIA component (Ntr-type)